MKYIAISNLYWLFWLISGQGILSAATTIFLLSFAWRLEFGNWWFK